MAVILDSPFTHGVLKKISFFVSLHGSKGILCPPVKHLLARQQVSSFGRQRLVLVKDNCHIDLADYVIYLVLYLCHVYVLRSGEYL